MNLYAQKLNSIENKVNRIYNILLMQNATPRTESVASHSPAPAAIIAEPQLHTPTTPCIESVASHSPAPAAIIAELHTPITPLASYKFNEDDLHSLHLSHFGYAFRHNDQTRHNAIDKALQRHSKDKVLKHLYAIWCLWEKRDSNYENTIKKDVVYVEGK